MYIIISVIIFRITVLKICIEKVFYASIFTESTIFSQVDRWLENLTKQ
jgi:hypothetical protein